MKREDFVKLAIEKHGDNYDFSLLPEEMKTKEKVPIICRVHGVFYKDFEHFVNRGVGCPLCSRSSRLIRPSPRDPLSPSPTTSWA